MSVLESNITTQYITERANRFLQFFLNLPFGLLLFSTTAFIFMYFTTFTLCLAFRDRRVWQRGELSRGERHRPWSSRLLHATSGLLPGNFHPAGVHRRRRGCADETTYKERYSVCVCVFNPPLILVSCQQLLGPRVWDAVFCVCFRDGVWAAQIWPVRNYFMINSASFLLHWVPS